MKLPFLPIALGVSFVVAAWNEVDAQAPTLSLSPTTERDFVLSWPRAASGFTLESAAELSAATAWQTVPEQPVVTQDKYQVSLSASENVRFFRLRSAVDEGLPPDPATVASALSETTVTDLGSATAFLYAGPNAIQSGVTNGTIDSQRAAVIRGKTRTRDGAALSGVRISVLGHPEFGQTLSRADGAFDLVVNGGGRITVRYEKTGFLPAQRAILAPWRDYGWLPEVAMVPFDPVVTPVDLNVATMQVARGSAITDADGLRKATVLFPPGTSASFVMPDGTTQTVNTLNIRATEYTVGPNGPAAMPATLPPASGYTYCVELSADEAVATGATDIRFNQALPVYVENFLDFPVGTAVPTGYYDRQKGYWIASTNGRVIKVLSITSGMADLDTDGDAATDDAAKLTALGISDQERTRLGQLYVSGQTLWRVPITHFTPWDCNWPYGPPTDAIAPPDRPNIPQLDDPSEECGSLIGVEN